MSKYLELVKSNAILAGELNKFDGISARITGAHTILATYQGVDVHVEIINTDKFICTRVQDGFCYTPFWLGQDAAWRVVQTATHDNGINVSPKERFWEGELDRETARNWAFNLNAAEQGGPWTNWERLAKEYSLTTKEADLLWREYDKLPHWNPWDLVWE